MANRLLTGLKFYLGFAPTFSRRGFERKGLEDQPVAADFSGQRWLVTGASGGIGREIAAQAARRGAEVLAVARSDRKLIRVRDEIQAQNQVEIGICDLSLRREVLGLVDSLATDSKPVDVLINNVGVLCNEHSATDEGLETSFATNLLNHYVLTERLIARDLLRPASLVINMSSGGMYSTSLLPDQLNITDPAMHDGVMAYARHKRAQVELTRQWNRRHGPEIVFHVMHPGWVDTAGVRNSLPGFRRLFGPLLRKAAQGADTAIWLAAERPPAAHEGIWLDRELQPEHVSDRTRYDCERVDELMEVLEQCRLGSTGRSSDPKA
jgi:dehydrogenase/reductase SDR family protein 12